MPAAGGKRDSSEKLTTAAGRRYNETADAGEEGTRNPGARDRRRRFGRGCSCRDRLGQCRDGRNGGVYHAPAAEAPTS